MLYFCSDENRKAMNDEFTVVQHCVNIFGMKANSAAIPQACSYTHTCTWSSQKQTPLGPYIMILYFHIPVPSVLAGLITGVGVAVPVQIQ